MPSAKSVAIIGAGPGGLAAAKYLVAEKTFTRIIVFDARHSVGGVWCATPDIIVDKSFTLPRTSPAIEPNEAVRQDGSVKIVSPVYDLLETNIPHTLMNYSDQDFPRGTPLFPPHRTVREYLKNYADDIQDLLCLGTQVQAIEYIQDSGRWAVSSTNLESRRNSTEHFDAVIVASGHYDDPYVPNIPGLKVWDAIYPGSISHSKFYRRPSEFTGKKVIIVGHSASGIDLANQIATVSQQPVIISEKNVSSVPIEADGLKLALPEIQEFLPEKRTVRFTNGHVETNVDRIVFCTGYMYSYPFLRSLAQAIVSDGSRVQNLYQHIFYHPIPTLSFVGLPQRIVPMPVSEAQSAVIARVLSGRLSLPTQAEMQSWEEDLIAERGDGKNFHTLKFPLDVTYMNDLHDWSISALTRDGLTAHDQGKIPPYWGAEKRWVRERILLIKQASSKLGAKRSEITSLAELGFDFDEEKNGMASDAKLGAE
ncbi:putative flavin dependent monooxygenase [Phlyctema vagabunda]|uniref:Flavin dependent monooxygenase n=1 Tax=Phlyctema vagabunda TaxID=108571 RepID=A0ABR4P488_9HELO